MNTRSFAILVLVLPTLSTLRADVTTRYKTEITLNPALSAMAAGAMKGTDLTAPQETALRLKNGKAFSSSSGFSSILDFPTKALIVLDPATMRYAKMTSEQFFDQAALTIPEMPATSRAAMASMKTSVSAARLTGRTALIQGVEAEEREIIISISGPDVPGAPAAVSMRMVMGLWTAKASEVLRVPAIRELAGYSLYAYATTNPLASIDKMMKQIPGFGSAFEPLMKEMQSGTPMLRLHIDIFMPAIAALLKSIPAGNAPGAALDDTAPFLQLNQELMELSSASVPDSVFQIPEGYHEASPSELVQALLAKTKAPSQQ
ncbi:MAG TPA: hypothetical protein VK724_07645 [Bryobacteraceae bacterium]|jgi:hypothetical protein|nr:hypothetical protein [Bryobacteraceae bacterium]